ncbi:MAG: AgmX/PglI C-terminal domain-containing protein [Bdellovibrionales bacterium]
MRKSALQVEHKLKNRLVGVHTIPGTMDTTTLGSSRTASIRVLGDEISGLHAAIEHVDGEWLLSDLGSRSGTWVNSKPVLEHKISGPTVIHIGSHQLKVTPHVLERDLFARDPEESIGGTVFHQVVILRAGLVQESHLLPATESYTSSLPEVGTLVPPKGSEWTVTESGDWTIRQRLARTDEIPKTTLGQAVGSDWRRPAPLAAMLLVFCAMILLATLAPQKPDDELKTITPQLQNQFTRMIYDGKKMRAKKAEAEKLRQTMQGQSKSGIKKSTNGGDSGAKVAGGSNAKPGAKVVTNLKKSGLGALIGRVAARASKDARLLQAAGVNADSKRAGRALSIGGGSSLDKLGGGKGGHGNETMKVGGLGTAGKGGGSSGYKGSGALSLGNTGNAEVGVLDDETEVDGGLDKEVIARYIKSQLGQIRYCYERQLSANPDLYGKIMVKFTIGSAGSVVAQNIGTTSLNNAMVEGCILRRIAGWRFPSPRGGTKVLVTYPFLFKSNR